jgi:hypothetical protein
VEGGGGGINKSEKLGSLRKHTDKNTVKFSTYIYRVQSGAAEKSYMRKGFLIHEEMRKYVPMHK